MHKNFDLGVEVAEHLLSLEPENPGHYVMLSNIYALAAWATSLIPNLDELMSRCREAGYIPASQSAMHEVEEEEREHALGHHSERLAIAFGLLKIGPGVPIRVVKNLRMCEDCHTAIKHISVISNREINVRDRLRFHHFKDGSEQSYCLKTTALYSHSTSLSKIASEGDD
ncbi:hypothetical protein V6N13_062943 [Hibiscus sabdariffa]